MQITRQRRRPPSRLPARTAVGAAVVATALVGAGIADAATDLFGTHQVGQSIGQAIVLPSNQTIQPIGRRILVDNGKLLSSTLSPDGTHLAAVTAGVGMAMTIFDLKTGQIVQQAGTSSKDVPLSSNNVGQEGPIYSPDGSALWMPQVNGYDKFPVDADGKLGKPAFVQIGVVDGKHSVPAGAAFSPDGQTVYAALNGQNAIGVLNADTGALLARYPVGNAPRQVKLIGGKLYVSDEGGRPATSADFSLNSYGTGVAADPRTGATTTGTVSVLDPATGTTVKTIDVGLHPTALYQSGSALFVANTGSDSVSVIDTTRDDVVQTFNTQPWSGSAVGYHPNAIAMPDAHHLLVSIGRANALAVYGYDGNPQSPVTYQGLLPTDYYPAGVVIAPKLGNEIVVTNERGIGSRGPERTIDKGPDTNPATGQNTHDVTGSLTFFTMPDASQFSRYTQQVFDQNNWSRAQQDSHGELVPPQPVPALIGEPSPIKNVFLIIKENRTYDQVLGDLPQGDGDPSLAQFGAKVTPNQHALATQFGLYDNTYDVGTNSAEGHNWLMQADNNEYSESQFGEYQRSYGNENDALGHQRDGFLWNAAAAAGKSTRVFGEYNPFFSAPAGTTWSDYYCDAQQMEQTGNGPTIQTDTSSPIPSLNDITVHAYPHFDLSVPDQYRVDVWKRDFEQNGPANLNLMWVMDDHTGGSKTPYPVAQAADNDLAVGRIVDEISHSRYWPSSAIFVIEDDSQNGVDHVDGHRGPVQVISPYAAHGVVDSHYYTQLNVLRTIEQILGMTPMNQKDRAATPMWAAFTSTPDLTPYTVKPNQIPLTYGLAQQPTCASSSTGTASPSTAPPVPDAMKGVYDQWMAWSENQHFTGQSAIPDYANPEQADRLTWYMTHNWSKPYPGDPKIYAPSEVPGAYMPAGDGQD